jgi:hypothetical protein
MFYSIINGVVIMKLTWCLTPPFMAGREIQKHNLSINSVLQDGVGDAKQNPGFSRNTHFFAWAKTTLIVYVLLHHK